MQKNKTAMLPVTASTDTAFSHAVPANLLQPNTHYYLTIEANSPVVSGGTKGFSKRVDFTTAP